MTDRQIAAAEPEAVVEYKTILKRVLENRPSGTRQRLAKELASTAPGTTRAVKSVIDAACPTCHPELEASASDEFARLWAADAHWTAVEALEQKRKTSR